MNKKIEKFMDSISDVFFNRGGLFSIGILAFIVSYINCIVLITISSKN